MENANIQKPQIDALFGGAKVIKLVCSLRLEFNIGLIHQGVSFCMHKDTIFKCEIKATMVKNFKAIILSVIVTKKKQF